MTNDEIIELVKILIWPGIALFIYLVNIRKFNTIFQSLESRIKSGSEIEFQGFKVGVALSLPEVKKNEDVTSEHLAIIHSSWRYKKMDTTFDKKMYGLQVIIQGQPHTLDRIEFVTYYLHPDYKETVQTKYDRSRNFELKELAWGESIIRAEVKIKGQEKRVKLSRFMNLSDSGERLLS